MCVCACAEQKLRLNTTFIKTVTFFLGGGGGELSDHIIVNKISQMVIHSNIHIYTFFPIY